MAAPDKRSLSIGTPVTLTGPDRDRAASMLGSADGLIVSDLYDRAKYTRPDHIAVKRAGHGLSLGVELASVSVR